MAYRVSTPALADGEVPKGCRVQTAFIPDGRMPRHTHMTVFVPLGPQAGGGSDGGTQLNRGLN
jgi:hypothetical protein